MSTLIAAVIAIVIARAARISRTMSGTGVAAVIWKTPSPPTEFGAISPKAISDPIMKTSPWAKLMSSMMP